MSKQLKNNSVKLWSSAIYSICFISSPISILSKPSTLFIILKFGGSSLLLKLAQNTFQYYFVLQSLPKNTSQYYFVLQSLHKTLPSTTLYYKACTKHFPVLLCTTKHAQATPQYYFVLRSLHKALPSTTVYYKACTNYFPVQLCTTKLAKSTSQYNFVIQSLHKVFPSTTLYCKACTKYQYFPLFFKQACTKKAFTHSKLVRREAFTHSKLFKQRSFYTQKLLHTTRFYIEKLLHTASKLSHTASVYTQNTYAQCFYTWQAFTHTETFTQRRFYTQRSFYTQNLLHTASFYRKKITSRGQSEKKDDFETLFKRNFKRWENPLTNHCRSLHAATPILFTRSSCKRQSYYACSRDTKQPWGSHYNAICRDWLAKHNKTTRNSVGNCSSKTGSRRQSDKKTILKHFLKGMWKGKFTSAKIEKVCRQITIAALMQPLEYDLT